MLRLMDSKYAVYLIAAFVSVLLSFWVSSNIVVLNPDAICYLQSAQTVHQGMSAVMSLCDQSKWPFYSVLIAGVVALTKTSYANAAYLLNGLFSLLTVLVFIRIIAFFTDKNRVHWLAAFVILFAHELNSFKQDIIRDHGFWFFYLLSVLFLLHYFKQNKWSYALGWSASLVFASLFRIEGAIFMMFMPMLVLFNTKQSWVKRLQAFLTLNVVPLVLSLSFALMVSIYPNDYFGRVYDLLAHFSLFHFYTDVIQHFVVLANGMGDAILGRSASNSYTIYFITLVVWYSTIVISTLSLVYSALLGYAWIKKLSPIDRASSLVLWGYISISIAVTFIFLVESQFISKRYIYSLVLILMFWIPFALDHLMQQWPQRKWPLVMAAFFMLASGVSGVVQFGHSKKYIHDAGDWLSHNTPKAAAIYSNDYQILYYSQHFGNAIFSKQHAYSNLSVLHDGRWKEYDYLALSLNEKTLKTEANLLKELGDAPVVVFRSKHSEDQVRIYQRNQQ